MFWSPHKAIKKNVGVKCMYLIVLEKVVQNQRYLISNGGSNNEMNTVLIIYIRIAYDLQKCATE